VGRLRQHFYRMQMPLRPINAGIFIECRCRLRPINTGRDNVRKLYVLFNILEYFSGSLGSMALSTMKTIASQAVE